MVGGAIAHPAATPACGSSQRSNPCGMPGFVQQEHLDDIQGEVINYFPYRDSAY